jgi:hypothetical protein
MSGPKSAQVRLALQKKKKTAQAHMAFDGACDLNFRNISKPKNVKLSLKYKQNRLIPHKFSIQRRMNSRIFGLKSKVLL